MSIDGTCLVPSFRSAEEREMVSAAHSAANRLNVQESAGLSDARARRDAAEPIRGIRPQNSATPRPNRLGGGPAKNREVGKQSRFIE
jgi:hypothetical protein